jgi:rhamnosyltransferase
MLKTPWDRASRHESVAAIVVTYFPDATFHDRLDRLIEQVSRVVIVDNGSAANTLAWRERYSEHNGITILENAENLGIAVALNQGMRMLGAEGVEWVVTLDQDSAVAPGFVDSLFATIARDLDPGSIAMIGANRFDAGMGDNRHRWLRKRRMPPFFERVACDRIGVEGVTLIITSGALTNISVFNELGPFRDDFFIDGVDSEYCLRARRLGYRIMVSCEAILFHELGSKRVSKLFGVVFAPTFHSPLRRYYIFRNRVEMLRLYAMVFPHWMIYETIASIHMIIGIILFENRKVSKLRACLLGTWDGLFRRMGAAQRSF